MPSFTLDINNQKQQVDVDSGTPLLWVLREHLGLTGTKYGCGISQCGACTVHLDRNPVRACVLPIDAVKAHQKITTIEGLSEQGDHPLQQAWIEAQAPQCGYCQSGQIMQAASLLEKNPHPTKDDIIKHMNGNICRCGTYLRIIKAIEIAAEKMA
ncbi:MAG: (2Fe-2S)-binding protein [Bacteroidota bacterium]